MSVRTLGYLLVVVALSSCLQRAVAQNTTTVTTATTATTATANITLEDVMQLFPSNRSLEEHEFKCQSTVNSLRYIHGVPLLLWNDFFLSLADSRALKMMSGDAEPSNLEIFSSQFLSDDQLSYVTDEETLTVTRKDIETNEIWMAFLAKQVDRVLREWYMRGLYGLHGNEGQFMQIIDPLSTSLGCAMRLKVIKESKVKMYFVVAYQKKVLDAGVARNFGHIFPNSERYCQSKCGNNDNQCMSYDNPSHQLTGRVRGSYLYANQAERCTCSGQAGEKEQPMCFGACFAYCPSATNELRASCYGKNICLCENGSGNAVCE